MTDQQIEHQIKTIKEVSKEIRKDKATARKFLMDAGIPMVYLKTGTKKKK